MKALAPSLCLSHIHTQLTRSRVLLQLPCAGEKIHEMTVLYLSNMTERERQWVCVCDLD